MKTESHEEIVVQTFTNEAEILVTREAERR